MSRSRLRRPDPVELQRLAGLLLLFAVMAWSFFIHLPVLNEGYFDAGDDHIHVAYTNELVRIWEGEDRLLGWSRLYGTGFPIFLLRPPGLYFAVGAFHVATGISVEESLKLVVVLGLCLFPLTIFAGARLLGLGFWPAILGGILAPLPISLWGHTIDAYHYLGVHKQLLAILLFPPTVGALWRLLKDGTHGLLFTVLFPCVMLVHPYIGYCLALLPAAMLLALFTAEEGWDWRRRIPHSLTWAIPTLLLSLVWLLPFYSSTEIQAIDPFLGVRKSFDVIVATSAETLRQFFLGGILDTTRWSGTFGGTHEWGWLDNSENFRLPILTFLGFVGWLVVLLRPRSSVRAFMSLAALLALLLLIGPDDFPFLDRVPFASQFQNIHAIFIFEWAAVTLGGVGWYSLFRIGSFLPNRPLKVCAFVLVATATAVPWFIAVQERTEAGQKMIRLRSEYTENGRLLLTPTLQRSWVHFKEIVDRINESPRGGAVAIRGSSFEETVLYNLLPHMVDRPVFTSGFQKVGGVYPILRGSRRNDARTNPKLQRLYDVRFVVTSTRDQKAPKEWPDRLELVHANRFWELREVPEDFGALDSLPSGLVGFVGSEREWAALMKTWLGDFRKERRSPAWIVNMTNSGVSEADLQALEPYLKGWILGEGARPPAALDDLPSRTFEGGQELERLRFLREVEKTLVAAPDAEWPLLKQRVLEANRAEEVFLVRNPGPRAPMLLKRAFYRGWEVELDGEPATVFRVSPGLQMILLPPGDSLLRWSYRGANGWAGGKAAFGAGVLLALVFWRRDRGLLARRRSREERASPESARVPSGRLRFASSAFWCVLIAVLAQHAYSEVYLKRPVAIRPPGGRYVVEPYKASRLDVHWNYVLGVPSEKQSFRVEIAKTPGFEEVLQSQEVSRNQARFKRAEFEPGEYYYRVRLETDDDAYAWTRPIRFEVEN